MASRSSTRSSSSSAYSEIMAAEIDIVIPTSQNLDFLEEWRRYLEPYLLIIVQDGDPSKVINVPEGFDYELYNRDDVNRILGPKASCISFNEDSACRCFGYMVSKKKYIYTVGVDCFVTTTQSGEDIDPLEQHIKNLLSSSKPLYFNSALDYPYYKGPELATAISHGLWLDIPDNDATTQLVNTINQNVSMNVPFIISVPKGAQFIMRSKNLAFNRELIGPAMYICLMGNIIGPHDDMWAGCCVKVICDHLGYGVKNGPPYIWCYADYPKETSRDTGHHMFLQEKVIPFFDAVKFPEDCTTAQKCFIELSKQVKESLGEFDPYFVKVADAMVTWIEAWDELNPAEGSAANLEGDDAASSVQNEACDELNPAEGSAGDDAASSVQNEVCDELNPAEGSAANLEGDDAASSVQNEACDELNPAEGSAANLKDDVAAQLRSWAAVVAIAVVACFVYFKNKK